MRQDRTVRLEAAFAVVRFVVENATAPVSVFAADGHGEIVAAATMDGAAPDTRLNAHRKAYTAARSDATSTAELAAKAREDAAERASFDPFFTFFQGGVAAFEDGSAGWSGRSRAAFLGGTTTRWRARRSRQWGSRPRPKEGRRSGDYESTALATLSGHNGVLWEGRPKAHRCDSARRGRRRRRRGPSSRGDEGHGHRWDRASRSA